MHKVHVVLLTILLVVCSQQALPQINLALAMEQLFGENNIEPDYQRVMITSKNYRHGINYSSKYLVVHFMTPSSGDAALQVEGGYTAPKETKIISAKFKTDDGSIIMILLSNGNIVTLKYDQSKFPSVWKEGKTVIPTANLVNAQKIIGDAAYVLKQGKIYASWDTTQTWSIDSINIGSETVNDIAVDTNHYGWVITQNRNLYYQHPDSNIWRKDTAFSTTGTPRAIFIDRKGRMFIYTTAAATRLMVSTDGGKSFTNMSTGINEIIASFGDDAFGNIYAVGVGSGAYRLSNLTPPWISIADSLNALAYLPSGAKIINSITGDTVLYAATRYGMFQSTDFGTNWVPSHRVIQSPAYNFYTPVVKGGNYFYLSNNLGIFRNAEGDTVWEKVFPKQGYLWGVNVLMCDSAGNVYGNLPLKTGPSTWIFYTLKSTDFGNSWIPDTAGFKALGINSGTQTYDYFVDRQGMQYLGGSGIFYSKTQGQAWRRDSAGIGMKSGEYIADVSRNNRKGIIYLCRRAGSFPTYTLAIYRRSITDSVWQVVNTNLLAATEGRMISDHDGNIVVRTISLPYKLWRFDGNAWTETPLPTGIGSSPFISPMTVDNDGVIWGVFFAGGSNKGVYFTANNGTSWKYVGLDKVGVPFLSAVEESAISLKKSSGSTTSAVYATSFIDGIYRFTTAFEPTSVEDTKPMIAHSYELYQNYPNPFNPSTTIRFQIPVSGFVSLKIFDVLGREVATLLNEEQKEGTHSVLFDASKLSTGVYIYNLKAGSYIASKKLMLMK